MTLGDCVVTLKARDFTCNRMKFHTYNYLDENTKNLCLLSYPPPSEDWWENELDQEDPLPSLSPTPPSSSSPPVTTGIDTQPEEPMEIENQQQQQLHVLPSSPKENKDQQQPQEPSSPPRKKR